MVIHKAGFRDLCRLLSILVTAKCRSYKELGVCSRKYDKGLYKFLVRKSVAKRRTGVRRRKMDDNITVLVTEFGSEHGCGRNWFRIISSNFVLAILKPRVLLILCVSLELP